MVVAQSGVISTKGETQSKGGLWLSTSWVCGESTLTMIFAKYLTA